MNRRAGVAAIALAVSAGLLLSACDGGDDPTDPPTTETSETTPAETETTVERTEVATPPEVEAPTPPPEASVDDHVGAIWATRHFLDLYAYMYATGETAQFEAMSTSECQFCVSSIEGARELHDAGAWVHGGAITFTMDQASAEYPTDTEPSYLVRIDAEEEPSTTHQADGSTAEVAGGAFQSVIALRYVDGRFIVFGVNTE